MNRFDKLALVAAVVVTLRYMPRLEDPTYTYYLGQMTSGQQPIWIAGLILQAYGPIAIAAWFWRWSGKASAAWILHLLFLPAILVPFGIGEALMLSVMKDPDFDATIGVPEMGGFFLLLIALVAYCGMAIARSLSGSKAVANAE